MLHVFIDTNVYLNFFGFAEDDLEELRKLRVAIDNGDLKLWVTQQTLDELRRNREAKLAESLQGIRKLKPVGGIPQVARQIPEFQAFLDARREFDRQLNAIADELASQIASAGLAADSVLAELLDPAEVIEVSSSIFEAARRRVDLGNPPGKRGSLGDAVNWECLLAQCPEEQDLYLVTGDSDYVSRVDGEKIARFLSDEWHERKRSEVHLYRRVSSLFRDRFPQIELASEFEKELRIRRLVESGSFAQTHAAVHALAGYSDYTEQQVRTSSRLRPPMPKYAGSLRMRTLASSLAGLSILTANPSTRTASGDSIKFFVRTVRRRRLQPRRTTYRFEFGDSYGSPRTARSTVPRRAAILDIHARCPHR